MEAAPSPVLAPATATYRGTLTTPERWATWVPREGDILVCTPPKSGTTWTQTILAMLLHGGAELPDRISVLSPWVDAALGDADTVAATLAGQRGRRVLKTHTPADGFPVWGGVTVVAVYRHPLDVFFSLRRHALNMKAAPDHPMRRPQSEALAAFLSPGFDPDDFDRDSLGSVARHFRATALSGRIPGLVLLHYAGMIADRPAAVRRLAAAAGIEADDALIDAVTAATGLEAMRARPDRFVPEGGKGFWESDAAFFDAGGTAKWQGRLSADDIALYETRIADLIPEPDARRWLESGGPPPFAQA